MIVTHINLSAHWHTSFRHSYVNMEDDDFKPPAYPAASLYWHILQKGWQAGSVTGAVGVVPFLAIYKKVRDPATLLRAMNYSAMAGTAASGIAM